MDKVLAYYAMEEELGSGAWGRVYKVHNHRAETFALKVLKSKAVLCEPQLSGEVRILSRLSHQNLVRFFEFLPSAAVVRGLEAEGSGYLMEYVDGSDFKRGSKAFPYKAVEEFFVQALRGLAYLHARRIIHGDLKPENLRISKKGTLKILDFGLAWSCREIERGNSSALRGTVDYLAPEALEGRATLASDLFSLGMIFYEFLSGRLAFSGSDYEKKFEIPPKPLSEWNSEVPGYFSDIIARTLEPGVDKRFRSAVSILRALNERVESPYPMGPEYRSRRDVGLIPLVGRAQELKKVQGELEAWRRRESASPLFIVSGPAGAGKSRLLREIGLQASLLGLGSRVWEGEEISSGALKAWVRGANGELGLFFEAHRYTQKQFADLFTAAETLTSGKLCVGMVVEIDESILDLPKRARLEEIRRSGRVIEIEVKNFQSEELGEFLREIFLDREIPTSELNFYLERCLGNPELTLGLATAMRKSGDVSISSIYSLPKSHQESLRHKWASLSESSKALLAALILLPVPKDKALLASMLGVGVEALTSDVDSLNATELISYDGEKLALVTDLYREPLKGLAFPNGPATLAKSLMETLLAEEKRDSLSLAWLAEASADRDIFYMLSMEAAESLLESSRVREAIELFKKALQQEFDAGRRAHCFAHLAACYSRIGLFHKAQKAYQQWYKCVPEDGTNSKELKYHYLSGLNFLNMGQASKARRELLKAVSRAEVAESGLRIKYLLKVHTLLGKIETEADRAEVGLRHFEMALRLANEVTPEKTQLLRMMGMNLSKSHPEQGKKLLCEAMEMSQSIGHLEGVANAASALADISHKSGDFEAALAFHERVLKIAEGLGDPLKRGRTLSNISALLIERGKYSKARDYWTQALPLLEKFGGAEDLWIHRFHDQTLRVYLGYFLEDEPAEFSASLAKGPQEEFHAYYLRLQGESKRLRRDYQSALRAFSASAEIFNRLHLKKEAALSNLHRFFTELLTGDFEAAKSLVAGLSACETDPIRDLAECLKIVTEIPDGHTTLNLEEIVAALSPLPCELKILGGIALGELLVRIGKEVEGNDLKSKSLGMLEEVYEHLSSENQLGFEHREDYRKMAEAKFKRLKVDGISREKFLTFARINRRLNGETDLRKLLEQVMDAAMALAGAQRGFLLLETGGASAGPIPGFRVKTARNLKRENLNSKEFQISLSIVQAALRSKKTILTNDAQSDPQFLEASSVYRYGLKSVLAIPLTGREGCFGAIYLDHRFEVGAFSEEKFLFLKALADQAVLAIEKAKLLRLLEKANASLEGRVQAQAQEIEHLEAQLQNARLSLRHRYDEIVGRSPRMLAILQLLDRITDSRIPVWVHGESGTGKELIARALHYNSQRSQHPFVAENCSAIPENLLESVLFGHVKGAFTHADRDRMGLFEAANGGTIFLDEIGDMPLPMQAKLLRVLQEGEIRRVGSNQNLKIDVRVVSASNKFLPDLVKAGRFREDLFFRLNGILIELPPLREKKEDIPYLVRHFLRKIAAESGTPELQVEEAAMNLLESYPWPGNIRELENTLRNAALFAEANWIRNSTLGFKPELASFQEEIQIPVKGEAVSSSAAVPSEEAARDLILEALVATGFHKGQAAEVLGVTVRHLYNLLEKHNLPKNKWALRKLVAINKVRCA